MAAGRATVGHPVDVATGAVYSTRRDIWVRGVVDLVWERRYDSAASADVASPLGIGWTSTYFTTLTRTADGYLLATQGGSAQLFADPDETIARGESVVDLGSFQELTASGDGFVLTKWNAADGGVERHLFSRGPRRDVWQLVGIEDVTGQGVDLTHDHAGRVASITQRLEGRTLAVEYDAVGRVRAVTVVSAAGERETLAWYEYDTAGRLSTAIDALGYADRFEYDASSRLTREVLRDGGDFVFAYDARGRCTRTSGLDGYDAKSLRYMDAIHWTVVTDSTGSTTRFAWTATGQVTQEVDPLGGIRTSEYDEHGRVVAVADPNGAVVRYGYDERGNRNLMVDELGGTYRVVFSAARRPLTLTDPAGLVWARAYDAHNRVIATVDPAGSRWTIDYDAFGQPTTITDPNGAVQRRRLSRGLLLETTDRRGNTIRFAHDSYGRVVEQIGAGGEATRVQYDPLGNPIVIVLPDGAQVRYTFDGGGNRTSVTDPGGRTTRFVYGTSQRLIERVDAAGGVVRYEWGSEPGRLLRIMNEAGEEYTFDHDAAGRVVCERGFDGREQRFEYDAAGRCVALVTGNEERVAFTRDPAGRLVAQGLPNGTTAEFRYDAVGNLLSAVNAHAQVTFERDVLGRVVREIQDAGIVETRFDDVGDLVRLGTSLGYEAAYEYDGEGRVNRLTLDRRYTLLFGRTAHGSESSRYTPSGVRLEQRYNRLGALVEQRATAPAGARASVSRSVSSGPGNEIVHRTFDYDERGAVAAIDDARWGRVQFAYDPAERLLQALRTSGGSETFAYDSVGNPRRATVDGDEELASYGAGGRLLRHGGTERLHDDHGRLVKKIEGTDGPNPREWIYSWDALDQLREVRTPDGETWEYRYDALGRRVAKIGPGGAVRYLWNENVIVQELTTAGVVSTWVHDPVDLAPLATLQRGGFLVVIPDQLGTPRELVDVTGRVVWSVDLSTRGRIRRAEHDVARCPLRFRGQWHDEETGLHYNRFRYYDPGVGRYVSPDPIGPYGGLNLYSYATNSVNWLDPFGLEDVDPRTINFSQRNVSGQPGQNPAAYQQDMQGGKWDWNRSGPIRVTNVNGQLVTYDNRTVMAAQNANLPTVPVEIVNPDAVITDRRTGQPVAGAKKTWAEAFRQRLNSRENRATGGALPPSGRKEQPDVEEPGCRT